MKNIILIAVTILNFSSNAVGQILLTYDAAGNRITKELLNTIPQVEVMGDTVACVGDILSLTASCNVNNTSYHWSTGSNNSTLAVLADASQQISVVGTTPLGCTDTVNIQITAHPYPSTITIVGDSMVTQGETITYTVPLDTGATYFWTVTGNNGIFQGGQGTNTVTILWFGNGTGTLTVTETSAFGCEGQLSTKVVDIAVGINEHELGLFEVYPNPSNANVVVTFKPEVSNGNYELSITDVVGKEIFRQKITAEKFQLQPDNFGNATGVYYISISDKKQHIQTQKIIRY